MSKTDVYETITNQIIEAMEQGATLDAMPWVTAKGMPSNAATGNRYNGVNIVSLWIARESKNYSTDIWATYKQWQDLGAQVKKGEKGTMIIFWKKYTVENDQGEEEQRMIARASFVFNADQVDGYTPETVTMPHGAERDAMAESFIAATGADIQHGKGGAFYNFEKDYIGLPAVEAFKSTDGYYATVLHELTHWTGAKNRLNRDIKNRFGDESYAFEELVAELGAAFLCNRLNITTEPRADHAGYMNSWIKVLKSDKKAIFKAASLATKAVDYLEGLQPA